MRFKEENFQKIASQTTELSFAVWVFDRYFV